MNYFSVLFHNSLSIDSIIELLFFKIPLIVKLHKSRLTLHKSVTTLLTKILKYKNVSIKTNGGKTIQTLYTAVSSKLCSRKQRID